VAQPQRGADSGACAAGVCDAVRARRYQSGNEAGYARRNAELEQQRGFAARFRSSSAAVGQGSDDAEGAGASGDPRQAGLNYYIVCRYTLDEARRAQQFLSDHGVATFLLRDDNTPFHEVIALRGFERIDAQAQAFKNQLDRLGRLWKRQHDGPDDFDPYARKHQRP